MDYGDAEPFDNAAGGHFNEIEQKNDTQYSGTSDESSEDSSVAEKVMIGFTVAVGVSMAINAALLVTVLSSRQLRRGASAGLVVVLTLSDMLGILFNRVLLEIIWNHSMDLVADVSCKAGHFLDIMFYSTSTFLLIAVAYDRYVAVCRPLSLQKRVGSPVVQGIVRAAICWVVATLLALPQLWINRMMEPSHNGVPDANGSAQHDYTDLPGPDAGSDPLSAHVEGSAWVDEVNASSFSGQETTWRICDRDAPGMWAWYVRVWPGFDFCGIFVLPMTIIAALYCRTAYTLVHSGTLERGNSADRLRRKRQHAARSLTALAVLNLLIMLPMNVLSLLFEYELVEDERLRPLAYLSFFTYAVSTSINAIVVCIISQKHRSQLIYLIRLVFCCGCCRRSGRHRLHGSRKTKDYRMERLRTVNTKVSTDDNDSHSHSTSTLATKYY